MESAAASVQTRKIARPRLVIAHGMLAFCLCVTGRYTPSTPLQAHQHPYRSDFQRNGWTQNSEKNGIHLAEKSPRVPFPDIRNGLGRNVRLGETCPMVMAALHARASVLPCRGNPAARQFITTPGVIYSRRVERSMGLLQFAPRRSCRAATNNDGDPQYLALLTVERFLLRMTNDGGADADFVAANAF